MKKSQWWGYLHTNGTIHVKRVLGNMDGIIEDAYESPFVTRVFQPFDAISKEEADFIINEKINHEKETNSF